MEIHLSPNNLFYFYSTVSQSIAGLIAFLGVFVVFRMQYLDGLIARFNNTLSHDTSNVFREGFADQINLYKKVEVILKKYEALNQNLEYINEARLIIINCKKLRTEKNSIRKYFILPAIFSIVTILTALIGIIAINPSLKEYNDFPGILWFNLISILSVVITMIPLLFLSLRKENTDL